MLEEEIEDLTKTYLAGESLYQISRSKALKKKRRGLKKKASLKIASYVISEIKEEIKSLKSTL